MSLSKLVCAFSPKEGIYTSFVGFSWFYLQRFVVWKDRRTTLNGKQPHHCGQGADFEIPFGQACTSFTFFGTSPCSLKQKQGKNLLSCACARSVLTFRQAMFTYGLMLPTPSGRFFLQRPLVLQKALGVCKPSCSKWETISNPKTSSELFLTS